MGWIHSPSYFGAFTETVRFFSSYHLPSNYHDSWLRPPPSLGYTDVYLDDLLLLAQPPNHLPAMNRILHALDIVFNDPPDSPCRQLVSTKKMAQGDTTFSTQKKNLGWDIDTEHMTLLLQLHGLHNLQETLHSLLQQKCTSCKWWQQLLGTLLSTSPALYGAMYLFSILQHALTDTPAHRIWLTPLLKASLRFWLHLIIKMHHCPVPIYTLVPRAPEVLTASDASKTVMGGFGSHIILFG
jgi:hypothetical protein